MRRLILAMLITALAPGLSMAVPGQVKSTLSLDLRHPTGLAFDGRNLWVADRGEDSFIMIDGETGERLESIDSPGWSPSGLAWDGELLWSTDPAAGRIYATDPATGLTVRTLESPTPSPTGIAWNGDELWICDNRLDEIQKIDPSDGTTIVSFPAPAKDPRGIVFGNGYIWCSDRLRDMIYMVSPENGMVVMCIDAPAPFPWGLCWHDGDLLCSDYQKDSVFRLVSRDGETAGTYDPRRAKVEFTTEAIAMGPGRIVDLDIFYADPQERPGQKLLSPVVYDPAPGFDEDRFGQRVAIFHFEDIGSGSEARVVMKAEVEVSAVRYYIYPDRVGDRIPDDIKRVYLEDGVKYDTENPFIQELVEKVAGGEKNLYWRARKLYQYLIGNMEYKLAGGWNTAPTVLKRGNGSCSEYSFSYVALCRAAGIPARYVGSLVVRGDDASYDEVFHRWNEIYLPGYGWVPVDANAGDKELPADQGAAFGGISNRFLITTEGGGGSEYLGWGYNHDNRYVSEGKCSVKFEAVAEWEPLE